MEEKNSKENEVGSKDFIDQKIQYGQTQIKCFACGENIDSGTKICPYCNTKQETLKS